MIVVGGPVVLAASNDGLFNGLHHFFRSETWLVIRNLSVFFVGVFWLSVAYWVYKDARRRIEDPWLVAVAIVLGLVPPFLGAFVYMLFRPPEYLEDVRERELEIKAMEARLARHELRCPVCRAEVQASFLACPVCATKLKQACPSCGSPLEALWRVCPYCEAPAAPAVVMGLEQTLEAPLPLPPLDPALGPALEPATDPQLEAPRRRRRAQ